MTKARTYARNLAANWVGYVANLAVMFFLSPFVVHSLGKSAYGVWTLLVSLTGYMGLVELGIRGALGRHINFYLGRGEIDKVNGFISTALAFFVACAIPLGLVAGSLGLLFGDLFRKVPAELVGSARPALLLVAVNLWLSLFGAAFSQIFAAFERFDLLNAVNVSVLAVRTAATVLVLKYGGGLVALATVQVGSSALALLLAGPLVSRVFPALRLRPALVSRPRLAELFSFGLWAFIGGIAAQLLYWTDSVVITLVLGPEQVTFYAIAGMLVIHGRGLVEQCASVFGPQVIQGCGAREFFWLRDFFQRSSTVLMAVGIVLMVGFIGFGHEFIRLWMGPEFHRSYTVLVLLSLAQLFAVAMMMGGSIYAGLNRVRLGASLNLLQGACNLGLTLALLLLFRMGIEGVALGAFFPRIIFACIVGSLAMRWIGLSPWALARRLGWRWLGLAVLFYAACLTINAAVGEGGWSRFALKAALALAIYVPLAWLVLLAGDEKRRWQTYVLSALGRSAA